MSRNVFSDPSGDLDSYSWAINHSEEAGPELTIPLDHTANTAGTGLVRQQGDPQPLALTLRGTILTQAQYVEFLRWFEASTRHTIYFEDCAENEYEVIMRRFTAPRTRVASNPRGTGADRLHIWRYEMELEIVTVRDGDLADVGITVP